MLGLIHSPQALKGAAEEYSRILDVMSRYAIFKAGVAFSCKRHVSPAACMQVQGLGSLRVQVLACNARVLHAPLCFAMRQLVGRVPTDLTTC